MRRRTVSLIAAKELLDTLRDRRTLFVALILPLLLYPALLLGLTQVVGMTQRNLDAESQKVMVDGLDPADPVVGSLRAKRLEPVAGTTEAAARLRTLAELIEAAEDDEGLRGETRAALKQLGLSGAVLFQPGFAARLAEDRRATAHLLFDPTDEASKMARGKAQDALDEIGRAQRERYLLAHPGDRPRLEFMENPVDVRALEVASRSQKGAYSFAPMLGMLIVLMSLTGAFYPAVDLVAGEKERGTMETLLVSPLSRAEIVVGKFFAVWSVAVATALLNLIVMGVTFSKLAAMVGPDLLSFSVPPTALLGVTLILVPTAALFGAVALALSAFAGSYKEGQHYLSPLFLVSTPLAMLGLLPGIDIGYGLAVVPVANVVLLVKAMLLGGGGAHAGPVVVAAGAMAVYAALALRAAVAIFRRERVLFRTGAGRGFDAATLRAKRAGLPSEAQAVFLFFTVVALMFYLSSRAPATVAGTARVILMTQLGAVLLPTLFFARRARLNWTETFSLRPMPARAAPAVVLVALATLVAVLAAQAQLMPERAPQGFEELLAKLLQAPAWIGFLLLAGIAPVCEELLCRGFLLSAFRGRHGDRKAILVTALLFGALHLDVARLPATAVAGAVAGILCVRTRSILAPMLFHFAYNGAITASMYLPALERAFARLQEGWIAAGAAGVAAVVFAGALALLRRAPV